MLNIEKVKKLLLLPFAKSAERRALVQAGEKEKEELHRQFHKLQQAYRHEGFYKIQEILNQPFDQNLLTAKVHWGYSSSRRTLIESAIVDGKQNLVALLLEKGSPIDDDVVRTAARMFSERFNADAIELLTAYGAKWDVVLDDGRTAAEAILSKAASEFPSEVTRLKFLGLESGLPFSKQVLKKRYLQLFGEEPKLQSAPIPDCVPVSNNSISNNSESSASASQQLGATPHQRKAVP